MSCSDGDLSAYTGVPLSARRLSRFLQRRKDQFDTPWLLASLAFQALSMPVPERIVAADGDDGEAWIDGGDKFSRRCIAGSVMPNFESIGVQIGTTRQQSRFAGLAGVAHEKLVERARTVVIAQSRDDAVLIDVVARIDEKWRRRRENVEGHTVFGGPLHPASGDTDWNRVRACRRHRIVVGASGIRPPRIEDHADGHRIDDGRCATYMIAVGN
jgi:hypothetical protein